MKLAKYVKPKKGLWNILPFLNPTAQAIYPNIYLPENVYNNLKTTKPKPEYQAVLIHEQTHLLRATKIGWIMWNLKYIFFPSFRFNEEIEADRVSIKHLKKVNFPFDINKRAWELSSYLYLWCVSYKKAREELN